jgi:hypothetical protein
MTSDWQRNFLAIWNALDRLDGLTSQFARVYASAAIATCQSWHRHEE